ncbi:MAG: hypothetical protein IPP82_15430 [Xanthomonadales bacterium]|nr:hypothetical protein [Xanthomonadales bacterium]
MDNTMFIHQGLRNESDVEQKFVYQLLIHSQGLEYDVTEISTKARIRKLTIDKGQSLKSNYFPDYVISIDAVPVLVIEAKGPGVKLDEAYREARLYANELNSQFPAGINPVAVVMAVNDTAVWVGTVDSSDPQIFKVEDITLQNESLASLRKVCGRMALASRAVDMRRKIWPVHKYKPLRFASPASQSEELEPNQFARQLIPLIKKFLDPDASRTRLDILQKAYVSTEQVTHYNEILEALLGDNLANKKFKSFEEVETTKNDAKSFNRTLKDALERGERTDSLLLLIGGVGSGKSIFIDRYFYFLMDDELRGKTLWAYVDFNDASEDLSNLRRWICNRVLEDLERRNSIEDIHSMENLQRYFNPAISRFRSSQGSTLYDLDRIEYERRLATKLDDWVSDPEVYLKAALVSDHRWKQEGRGGV